MDALPSAYRSTHAMSTHRGYDTTTLIDIAENLIAVEGDRDLQVTTNDFHPDRPRERVVETRSASALVAEYRRVVDERLAAYRSARLNAPGDTQ
ncbi:hypothetical protein [Nocardioides sp. Leaf285]|uniref:hypothetical protein n=1 Tax=Nocardioides sp. Leaf285 TaxID=1736322 RepID=UPI0007037180|nr:hypothetical protein [Nocardioides sp. Leaf285]KQP63036.1 hypothetical protein ASF47_18670 [Nocardioides sp. Leaf285]